MAILLRFARYVTRTIFGLTVLCYIAASCIGQLRDDLASFYPSPSWLLLIVIVFGIIGVRLGSVEATLTPKERRRIWPYVVCGAFLVGAIMYWATNSYALVWQITMGLYAVVMLSTLMLIMFED